MTITTDYQTFLSAKHQRVEATGFKINYGGINPKLFLFQNAIVRWALELGKAAIFAECGLGKTAMQLEWGRHVAERTGGVVLILCPLAVAEQTVREGEKFGITVKHVRTMDDIGDAKLIITNYERLHLFKDLNPAGIILDESSILKNFTGKTKRELIDTYKTTPYKLACTATPAPNDHLELGNHAEFLNIMPSNEMIARWFINDSGAAGVYRLKGHAEADFWRWLTSWAVCISKPGDLAPVYDMPEFNLPTLNIHQYVLSASQESIERAQKEGRLLPDTAVSSTGLHTVKRESLKDRVKKVQDLVEAIPPEDAIVIWCDTNYEADALVKAFPEAVEVRGQDKPEVKEERLRAFTLGEKRMIITKAEIAGFGLNWQHCHQMIYAGVGFSFEKLYQSLKRAYRFGQTRPVEAHLIYSETEGSVQAVLKEKQAAFEKMQASMNAAMREYGLFRKGKRVELTMPDAKSEAGKSWEMRLGDCVPTTKAMPDNSIDLSVYSPPFASLYIYSGMEADMGNSRDTDEFMQHYRFLVGDLYRVTKPGRLTVVHVKDLPIYKNHDGWFGIEDFSGYVRDAHLAAGWIFHSRITIWKDPVTEMEKTNSHGLLHRNFASRTQVCRVGLPDYLLVFVKPDPGEEGVNVEQHRKPGDYIGEQPPLLGEYADKTRNAPDWYSGTTEEYNYSIAVWQRYASPVWFDIDQTDVLNVRAARSDKDSKHMCPLPLGVSARSIDLWSNPGELVYSPFGGIGSEGWSAIKLGRRFLGVELKPEYFNQAVGNLKEIERQTEQPTLFDWAAQQAGESKQGTAT